MSADLGLLSVDDFRPYLNQTLPIRFEESVTMPAELAKVTALENRTGIGRQPFSVVFRTAQKDNYYQQAIYILEHPVKGNMEIFLVPLGPDGVGMKYEAVFS